MEEVLHVVRNLAFNEVFTHDWSSPELGRAVRSIGVRRLCDDTRGAAIEAVIRSYRRFREERLTQEMIGMERQLEAGNG